ncbi:MAG: CBS domain-containing protein [Pseudomonadota bacterium]
MTVRNILRSRERLAPVSIPPDAPVSDAVDSLADKNIGALVVSRDGVAIEGIISERDVVRGLRQDGSHLLSKPVCELMTPDVYTCVADDRASGVMASMVDRHIRHMPVVEDGRFVGMVSIRDLMQLRLTEVQSEAEAMRSYIAGDLNIED